MIIRRFRTKKLLPALLVTAISVTSARAVTYTATLLHPIDDLHSQARGVTDTYQVGYAEFKTSTGYSSRALLWTGTATSAVDLTPPGYFRSWATGAAGNNQVGSAYEMATNEYHALLWSGTAVSGVDLRPLTGFNESIALGVSETSQVGAGRIDSSGNSYHALLWHGSAASVVDLHPAGYHSTQATAVSGDSQVGFSFSPQIYNDHALLWHGTPAGVVDLHPAGAKYSQALGVFGNKQVGYSATDINNLHAMLWSGTAASAVDLNPLGSDYSAATAISSAGIVGSATGSAGTHAMFWKDTPASAIDLHSSLSSLGISFHLSMAIGISDNGSIVGTAHGPGQAYAVLWTPVAVPETASATLLICGFAFATLFRIRIRPHC